MIERQPVDTRGLFGQSAGLRRPPVVGAKGPMVSFAVRAGSGAMAAHRSLPGATSIPAACGWTTEEEAGNREVGGRASRQAALPVAAWLSTPLPLRFVPGSGRRVHRSGDGRSLRIGLQGVDDWSVAMEVVPAAKPCLIGGRLNEGHSPKRAHPGRLAKRARAVAPCRKPQRPVPSCHKGSR